MYKYFSYKVIKYKNYNVKVPNYLTIQLLYLSEVPFVTFTSYVITFFFGGGRDLNNIPVSGKKK